jgi:hypothetical protein
MKRRRKVALLIASVGLYGGLTFLVTKLLLGETFVVWQQGGESEFYVCGWQLGLLWMGIGLLGGYLIFGSLMRNSSSTLLIEGFEDLPPRPEYLPITQHLLGSANYARARLEKLQGGYESSGVFVVRGHNRTGQDFRDRVLKLGNASDISAEQKRYEEYVQSFLSHNSGRSVSTYSFPSEENYQALAGVLYDFTRLEKNSEVRNLQDLYLSTRNSHTDLATLLRGSFTLLIESWYEKGEGRRINQYQDYPRLLKKLTDITLAVQELVDPTPTNDVSHRPEIQLRGIRLRNPVSFVNSIFRARMDSFSGGEFTHRSIIHGDFHSRNILVEGSRERKLIWFIDFSNTQEGPTLRDFCSLEADIKFGLLMKDEPASAWDTQTWGTILEAEERFSPWINSSAPFVPSDQDLAFLKDHPEVFKAWRCVAVIRGLARKFKKSSSWSVYALPLLHATLPIVYYQQCSTPQKKYALISSGWLCDSL